VSTKYKKLLDINKGKLIKKENYFIIIRKRSLKDEDNYNMLVNVGSAECIYGLWRNNKEDHLW